jgi:hypothetical protein
MVCVIPLTTASPNQTLKGGDIETPDGSVHIHIPPGAVDNDTSISITETGTSFELATNLGNGTALFGVSIQPEGTVFNVPITITFSWTDGDDDGKIDGTNINEDNVIITKDNEIVIKSNGTPVDRCKFEPGPLESTEAECKTDLNYFKFQVSSLSEFAVVFVDELGPVTSNVAADPSPLPVNTSVMLTAAVDDTETGGSVIGSAEYRIDDGSDVLMDASDGSFDDEILEEVEATLLPFAEAGVHTICVKGWDTLENVAGAEECIFLPVYDPEGGFVTGGGWIMSPEGAYYANPLLTGKANFGFVSKYKKGATIPTGVTEFQFKVADLNFHSDSYEWLVIAGAKAQYKGVGTINGMGEYKFMLSAIDADINDTDVFTVDLFRIKIWTEDDLGNENVVYDNAMTEIGGGSIVIHKGK